MAGMAARLLRLRHRLKRDPVARRYRDLALTPVEETGTLGLLSLGSHPSYDGRHPLAHESTGYPLLSQRERPQRRLGRRVVPVARKAQSPPSAELVHARINAFGRDHRPLQICDGDELGDGPACQPAPGALPRLSFPRRRSPAGQGALSPGGSHPADRNGGCHDGFRECLTTPLDHRR